jgi:hypothetical protein
MTPLQAVAESHATAERRHQLAQEAARRARHLRNRRTSGIPDHRDSILADDEQAEKTALMVCVSRSQTPTLILDL